jgi:hypothetical protein
MNEEWVRVQWGMLVEARKEKKNVTPLLLHTETSLCTPLFDISKEL